MNVSVTWGFYKITSSLLKGEPLYFLQLVLVGCRASKLKVSLQRHCLIVWRYPVSNSDCTGNSVRNTHLRSSAVHDVVCFQKNTDDEHP